MNLRSGVFTAQKNGIYLFSFVGIKNSDTVQLVVQLRKNKEIVGQMVSAIQCGSYTITLTSILNLKTGDTVDLYKTTGDLYDDEGGRYTHFTGRMIDEDLTSL